MALVKQSVKIEFDFYLDLLYEKTCAFSEVQTFSDSNNQLLYCDFKDISTKFRHLGNFIVYVAKPVI